MFTSPRQGYADDTFALVMESSPGGRPGTLMIKTPQTNFFPIGPTEASLFRLGFATSLYALDLPHGCVGAILLAADLVLVATPFC